MKSDYLNGILREQEHIQLEDDVQDLIGDYIGRDFICSDEKQKDKEDYFKARNILEKLIIRIRNRE